MISTIYPEDPALTQFYKLYHTIDCEQKLSQALDAYGHPLSRLVWCLSEVFFHSSVEHIPGTVAVQNFPVLVQMLCHVMCVNARTPGFKAFRALLKILNKVHSATREKGSLRSRLLQSYVYHAFDPGEQLAEQVLAWVSWWCRRLPD